MMRNIKKIFFWIFKISLILIVVCILFGFSTIEAIKKFKNQNVPLDLAPVKR